MTYEFDSRHAEIAATVSANYSGIQYDRIYCLMTGKVIGTTDCYELDAVIRSIKGDTETVADDLAVRIFASMRPSMVWNKLDADSINRLRKSAPIETLAYLLNQLFTNNSTSTLALHHDRIRLFQRLESWKVQYVAELDKLLSIMIELDAKLGLKNQSAPFSAEAFLKNFESMEKLFAVVIPWHADRVAAYDHLVKMAEQTSKFYRSGATTSKPAYVQLFMENKVVSPATQKKREKKEDVDFMRSILFEQLGKPNLIQAAAIIAKPLPAPVSTKSPFAKKG